MTEWIACSDRLPDTSGVYPACSMHPQRKYDASDWVELLCMFDAKAKPGESKWQHSSGFYDNAITHWLPLPTPPAQ